MELASEKTVSYYNLALAILLPWNHRYIMSDLSCHLSMRQVKMKLLQNNTISLNEMWY